MFRSSIFILSLAIALLSCDEKDRGQQRPLAEGPWRFVFDLNGEPAPVLAEITTGDSSAHEITFINGDEHIPVQDIRLKQDSIVIRMPLYDSELRGIIVEDGNSIRGAWYNFARGNDYKVPFHAKHGVSLRFRDPSADQTRAIGSWAVQFDPGTADSANAIGIFRSNGPNGITGTFATETGDHRFLDGAVRKDSLFLSSFDGSHIYLYKAHINGDHMSGMHFSGIHWKAPFTARRDPGAQLRDPASLTKLSTDTSRVSFDLVDLDGQRISSNDERFRNKVLVVHIMGSWCSNCTDSSIELARLYRTHKKDGLEVVALAFEKHADAERAKAVLERYRKMLGLEYPLLYAGKAGKETLAQQLPFLDRVQSYPTTIFIDHTGKVRSIHSGTYGPGTGELYKEYRAEVDGLIGRLIQERHAARTKAD